MVHLSLSVLRGRVTGSAAPYDLEVELPDYVYQRLGLARKREITISIHRSAMHVIPVT